MAATYTCDLLKRYGSNGKNESSGLDPLPNPPALVTLEGVHVPLDADADERGVEKEKPEPIVMVCDTSGRYKSRKTKRGVRGGGPGRGKGSPS